MQADYTYWESSQCSQARALYAVSLAAERSPEVLPSDFPPALRAIVASAKLCGIHSRTVCVAATYFKRLVLRSIRDRAAQEEPLLDTVSDLEDYSDDDSEMRYEPVAAGAHARDASFAAPAAAQLEAPCAVAHLATATAVSSSVAAAASGADLEPAPPQAVRHMGPILSSERQQQQLWLDAVACLVLAARVDESPIVSAVAAGLPALPPGVLAAAHPHGAANGHMRVYFPPPPCAPPPPLPPPPRGTDGGGSAAASGAGVAVMDTGISGSQGSSNNSSGRNHGSVGGACSARTATASGEATDVIVAPGPDFAAAAAGGGQAPSSSRAPAALTLTGVVLAAFQAALLNMGAYRAVGHSSV
jgi:hypothetical protein